MTTARPDGSLSMPQLEESLKLQGRLVEMAVLAAYPALSGSLVVDFSVRHDYFFRAYRFDADHVKLQFGVGAAHPRFREMLTEAGLACVQVRFTHTTAVEIRQDQRPICSHCLQPINGATIHEGDDATAPISCVSCFNKKASL